MAYGEMTFTLRRLTRTGDGAGGKVETPVTVGFVTGESTSIRGRSQRQLEREDAPARAVSNEQFVAFDDPDLNIRQHDQLVEGASGAVGDTDEIDAGDLDCKPCSSLRFPDAGRCGVGGMSSPERDLSIVINNLSKVAVGMIQALHEAAEEIANLLTDYAKTHHLWQNVTGQQKQPRMQRLLRRHSSIS